MANRIFLALDLDEPTRAALAAAQDKLRPLGAKVRWVGPQNIHVTLCFLGDVTDDFLAQVCRAVRQVAAGHRAFSFDVRGIRCVPPSGRLRMLWAESPDTGGEITRLQADLAQALAALGLPKEKRKYQPHLTLARVKHLPDDAALRRAAGELGETHFGSVQATQVTVYSSKLGPTGPTYTPVAAAPLGGD